MLAGSLEPMAQALKTVLVLGPERLGLVKLGMSNTSSSPSLVGREVCPSWLLICGPFVQERLEKILGEL